MGLTITIHLIRCADASRTAGLGDGGGTVTWLPGRVVTAGRAAAVKTAEAASQIPADCSPEVSGEGVLVPCGRLGRPARPYGPAGIVHASGMPGGRVMAWPAAGYGVLAAAGRRGEEDEQA